MANEIWSVGKSPDPRVKSLYLYVEEKGVLYTVARFYSEELAEKTLAMLKAALPTHRESS